MQGFPVQQLAARALTAWALAASAAQAGGIPVADPSNLLESITQTLQQAQQFELQLEQFKNMEKNTDKPSAYVWDQASDTMGRLLAAMDTMDQYRNQASSLEKHLQQFKDVDGYQASSPSCANAPCNGPQWGDIAEKQAQLGARTQKSANDALLRSLDQQQQTLRADARQLQRLQGGAEGAQGQMQALGAANQLASHVAHQLQQIRAVLVAQNTALAARQQATASREALSLAAQKAAVAPRMGVTPRPLDWLGLKP